MTIYSAPRTIAYSASDLDSGFTLGDLQKYHPGATLVECRPNGLLKKNANVLSNPKTEIQDKDYMLVVAEGKSTGGKAEGGDSKKDKKAQKKADKKADKADKKAEKKEESKFTEKQIKAAKKEGGKKGQDLSGLADLGGVKHFTVAMHNCEGEMELLKKAMEGMNVVVDETADDRKGGAGEIAKSLLAANEKQLCILVHVPANLKDTIDIKDWAAAICAPSGHKATGKVNKGMMEFIIKGDASKGRFPLKMRDEAINASFAYLKDKMLVMDDESSDDDVNLAEVAGIEW